MEKEYYMAVVTRNVVKASGKTTPEQTSNVSSKSLAGAVFFQCNNISDGEYPIPAKPTFGLAGLGGGGHFWVPKIGDSILVMLDTSLDQPQPYYIASIYTTETPMHEEWEINYPNRMGWMSNIGHQLMFDDTDYDETVRLKHTFGTQIEMDWGGNYSEKVVASRRSEVAGKSEYEIRKNLDYLVIGSHEMDIRRDYDLTVKGNHNHRVKGNYNLVVDGNFTFDQKQMIQNFGSTQENVKGSKEITVGGGMNVTVGGCLGHAVLTNYSRTTSGSEALLVAGRTSMTYGLGYDETIPLGNKTLTMLLGNYSVTITAGNIDLLTLAGATSMGNVIGKFACSIAGAVSIENLLGSVTVDATGGVEIKSPVGLVSISPVGAIDVSNPAGGLSIAPTGEISLSNPLGEFSMSPAGLGKFGGSSGYVEIDPVGNITVFGTSLKYGTGLGNVLTTKTAPVVDTITGALHLGLPTFTAG